MEDTRVGSDSDSSDDDASQPELSDADMKGIISLEQALESDPKAYDTHVQYIAALRGAKLTERLKAARRAMYEYFPLTEELWSEWLDDETSDNDVPQTKRLFESAIADYVSVALLRRYLKFLQDAHLNGAVTATEVRHLNERALSAAGLHVNLGSDLWTQTRDWEVAQLAKDEADGTQRDRVRSLFQRQLQVPLADGDATLRQYHAWESSLTTPSQELPASIKQGYNKAQAAAKLRAASEAAVEAGRPADHDLLAAFSAYLKLEETSGDPARQQMVFERALVAFPVTSYLWLQYARFAEVKLKSPDVINKIYKRAARNCPWVGSIWARGLYALERSGASNQEHAAHYSRAIASGLQTSEDVYEVVLSRIDFVRRHKPFDAALLRETFEKASATLQELVGEAVDAGLRLTAYWADCNVRLANDIAAARAVWEDAVRLAAGRSAGPWSAYIAMEQALHNTSQVRSLYKRCYTRHFLDGSQTSFCHAWIRFEREEGSAEEQLQASLKVEPILDEAAAAAAAAADAANTASATAAMHRAPMLTAEEMREMRRQKDPNYGQSKGKKAALKQSKAGAKRSAPPAASAHTDGPSSKRARPEDNTPSAATEDDNRLAPSTTLTAAEADNAVAMESDTNVRPEGKPMAAAPSDEAPPIVSAQGHEVKGAPTLRDDSLTVFVKNMNFKVTDKELWDFFLDCGTVIKVAVKRDDKGNSKGFAFVHFNDEKAVQLAISKNQTPLRGRPLVIQQSQPLQARGGGGRGGGRSSQDSGRGARGRGRGRNAPLPSSDRSDAAAGAPGAAGQEASGQDADSLGRGAGPEGWASGRAGKQKLELKRPMHKAGLGFTPRSVAVANHEASANTHIALQNKDFRNMLLAKAPPTEK